MGGYLRAHTVVLGLPTGPDNANRQGAMPENDGALNADLENEAGNAGSGAPAGGSPDGGSGNDGSDDDEFVPVSRLKAALAGQKRHYEGQLEGVRREVEALKAGLGARDKQDPPAKQRYTRADLRKAVEAEQITQEAAEQIWDEQTRQEAREDARREAKETVEASRRADRVETDLASYKRLAPDVMDQGSETRDRVVEEYNYLVSIGAPQSLETELAATRAVLGPLDKLRQAKSVRRPADTHQESGADGAGQPAARKGKKLVDQLTPREKEHYSKGISAGRYKSWDDVEAELQFANPHLRSKMGARAA